MDAVVVDTVVTVDVVEVVTEIVEVVVLAGSDEIVLETDDVVLDVVELELVVAVSLLDVVGWRPLVVGTRVEVLDTDSADTTEDSDPIVDEVIDDVLVVDCVVSVGLAVG